MWRCAEYRYIDINKYHGIKEFDKHRVVIAYRETAVQSLTEKH